MIDKMNLHYAFTNPASIHDEEALTALELAGRQGAKINEVVDDQNALRQETEDHLKQQDNTIKERLDKQDEDIGHIRTVTVPEDVNKEVQEQIDNGTFDRQIDESLGNLVERVNNLLHNVPDGSTTMDAEIIDMRVSSDGTTYANAGEAVRKALTMGNLIDDTTYASKLPDANMVLTPSVYVVHFSNGATNITKNLPFNTWHGRIGIFMTLAGTYNRQLYIDDNQIYTRNGTRSDNWSEWKSLTKPEYIIDVNGNGDFSSILRALQAHPTNTRFIIKAGVYDIMQQYTNVYGEDYFTNYNGYAGTTDVMNRGLFLGDGIEMIGEGHVELIFNYTDDNEKVKQYFSVISPSQNNVLENLVISVADDSCRYIIHDDYANAGGSNIFRNLICSGYTHLGTAIGGGFGTANTYLIENCVFTGLKESIAISYHNNVGNAKNTLTIKDCKCEGSIYLKHYGTSTHKSRVYVSGCEFTKLVLTYGDKGNFPNENITLQEWDNNISIEYTNKDLTDLSMRLSDIDGGFITHFIHGNMGIDENGLLYYEYESNSAKERIITPENEKVYLKSGDVVKLSDYTNLAINIFYEDGGVWQYITKTSNSYTVTNSGNHCFMILPTNNEIIDISVLSKKLVIERNSNLQDNINTSFELFGEPSNYIRNVKILSNEYKHLLITNIRNNYDTQGTGFALYESNENGEALNVLLNVSNLETKTFYNGMFGGSSKIFLDFDVAQLEEGKRISTSGKQNLIKQTCIFNYKDTVDYLSLSTFEKFGVIGDSFASGEIYVGGSGKDYYNLSWGQILARMTGTSCVNFSKGGLNTRTWLSSEMGLSLMTETEPQNLYWLMLGINDVGKLGENYLGTIDDITDDYNNNPDSFYGNYARIIEQIKEHAPNSKMIISTMAYKGGLYTTYNNAIKEIASHYSIPCIVQRNDEFLNSSFYWDNMKTNHPTALLYSGMAKAFIRLFNKCAYENIDYFKDYVG